MTYGPGVFHINGCVFYDTLASREGLRDLPPDQRELVEQWYRLQVEEYRKRVGRQEVTFYPDATMDDFKFYIKVLGKRIRRFKSRLRRNQ